MCVQLTFVPNLCIILGEIALILIGGVLHICWQSCEYFAKFFLIQSPRSHVTSVETNRATGVDGAVSLLESDIDNGNFWSSHYLFRSPGDGHCLVHSVLTCLQDLGMTIEMGDILDAIEKDTVDNAHVYLRYMATLSLDVLMWEMKAYVYQKHDNSSFGGLVPYIIANSLRININIISKLDRYSPHGVTCSDSYPVSNIFVYKQDIHYYAILYKRYTIPSTCDNSGETVPIIQIETTFLGSREAYSGMNVDSHNACESLTNESLRILFWNVNGLTQDKLHDDILGKLFKEYDIVLLSETWANEQDYFGLSGFNYLNYPRKYSHPNCKRNSGGLEIFIKTSLANGISEWCHTDDVVAWVILDKSVFGLRIICTLVVFILFQKIRHTWNIMNMIYCSTIWRKFPAIAKSCYVVITMRGQMLLPIMIDLYVEVMGIWRYWYQIV